MPEFTNNNLLLYSGLVACAIGVLGISYLFLRRDRRKYSQVGVVSKLFIHPIKSCRGLEVSQAECVALGMKSNGVMDRSFLITDAEGRFVTGRQQPSIALISPSVSEDKENIVINAPGMPTLTVPLNDQNGPVCNVKIFKLPVDGEDCGQEASEWLSQYFGSPGYKLIRHSQRFKGKILKDDPTWGSKAKEGEQATYQDLAQVHILSLASLDSLNSKLAKPVQIRNFRPNIVVEGTPAFYEDKWKYVRIGEDALMRTTHLCGRCRQTTVDPDTGTFIESGDPLKTLKMYRMATSANPDQKLHGTAPLFGTNLAVEVHGSIKIGDPIFASMN